MHKIHCLFHSVVAEDHQRELIRMERRTLGCAVRTAAEN